MRTHFFNRERRCAPGTGGMVLGAALIALLTATAPAAAQDPPSPPAAAEPGEDQALINAVRHRAAAIGSGEGAAVAAFYAGRSAPLWVNGDGLTSRAELAIAEIARADDWGLGASAFVLPHPGGERALPALADAEVTLSLAVLAYARAARGGRIDVANFSRSVDQQPSFVEPKAVLEAIAASDAPGAYLQGLHPRHRQFVLLRRALLALRSGGGGERQKAPGEQPVTLPDGPLLKPGITHPQVALLRRRLNVAGPETLYDAALAEAVMAFQREQKMTPDGIVGGRVRAALNRGREDPPAALFGSDEQRLIINMERWRWMPEDLGAFHVWDNVPEFLARVLKNGEVTHKARIVAGKPETQTVMFSADMRYVVFHPEWGVPDSIKIKELLPYLRPSSGDLFGIFGGADTRVLERHNLKVSYNGHPVDASQVDWNAVDVRRFSFVQPAGAGNVLGVVKFRFPNRHDIYMHDTPQKELFDKTTRAFSHGCIRVQHPGRLAELLLAEDKGWPAEQVRGLLAAGYNNEVALEHPLPVHVTYFTAVAGEDGTVAYFGDIYGLDKRVAAALQGEPLPPEAAPGEETFSEARRARKGYQQSPVEFFSGLFGN
jgi:murein L,D-transpeptidase YcbB/YkuD